MKLYVISLLLLSLIVLAPSRVLSQDDNELERARLYVDIAKRSNDIDTIKAYAKMAYDIAMKRKNIPLLIDCTNNLAFTYGNERKYDSAIIYYKHHYILVSDDSSHKEDVARTLGNLGICYKNTDKYMDMWSNFRQSKNLFEQLGDTDKICWTTIEMGEAYEHFGMYQQARDHYNNAIDLAAAINAATDIAKCHYNIGNTYLSEYFDVKSDSTSVMVAKARDYIMLAINDCYYSTEAIADSLRHKSLLALSRCYMTLLKNSSQQTYYADSCRLYLNRYMETKAHKTISDSLVTETMKAMLMINDKEYAEAIDVLENAAQLPVKVTDSRDMSEVYKLLSESYAAVGKFKEAYMAKKQYNELYNKVSNEQNLKRTANFAAQTQIDGERENQLNESKLQEAREAADEVLRQNIFQALAAGIVMVVIITLAIIVSLRKKNRLNQVLNDRSDKLRAQRDVIEQQKNDEQQAQSIILSSVQYASKIQSQAIGNTEIVAAVFPESFVYYRPRNIVSGDWYMATILKKHKLMIEADCTGHGIPGALLCMLGVSAMKDIINNLRHSTSAILPGLILDEMRASIKKALNKDTADSKSNIDDGMDMSIVILPPDGDKLLFGGANQSAILISSGETIRLKGDANPIGNYVREKEHFSTIETPVCPGDAVYLFSDGIQDQTGGDDRKYSLKRMMTLFAAHYTLPMQQQLQIFENDLDSYAGEHPQVDDRTLVGIRIQRQTT